MRWARRLKSLSSMAYSLARRWWDDAATPFRRQDGGHADRAAICDRGAPWPGPRHPPDRRDGTTQRWARTLRGGRDARSREVPRRCANCGAGRRGGYYKPPLLPAITGRLCVACVAGDVARPP